MIIQHTNFGTVSRIRCGIHSPTHNYGDHIHEYSEMLYVLDGSIESTVNGKTDLLRAGDIAFITPFKIHKTYTPDSCKVFICVISNDYIYDIIPKEQLYCGYESAAFTPSPSLKAYLDDRFIVNARRVTEFGDPIAARTAKACIHAIVDEFLATAQLCRNRGADDNVLSALLLYLHEHFAENIDLASVSRAIGYTPGYVSHCLEKLPGFGFSTLLSAIRVEHAKGLLREGGAANVEVAIECGFNCERSFYRAFLRHVGMTPKQYTLSRKEISW